MGRFILFACALALWASSASAERLQDRYNAAEQAFAAGEHEKALALFTDVLGRMSPRQRDGVAGADLRGRIAETEIALGNPEGAIAAVMPAISTYAKVQPVPSGLTSAHRQLGRAHEALGEMQLAAASYDAALKANSDPALVSPLSIALARVSVFVDPSRARRLLDAAIADFKPLDDPQQSGEYLGELQTLRGRVELNAGNHEEALVWFEKAAKSAGGLGRKVSLSDIVIRGDLAIASYLTGDDDAAFRYTALTGSGRMGGKAPDFPSSSALVLPDCAPATDIDPNDLVIVDSAVDADGRVFAVTPIYSSKPGKIESAFVRAVRSWTWTAEQMKDTVPFWRGSIRIALRCRKSADRLWVGDRFLDEVMAHTATVGMPFRPTGTLEGKREQLLAELQKRQVSSGGDTLASLPILIALVRLNPAGESAVDFARRAKGLAIGLTARDRAILDVLVLRAQLAGRNAPFSALPDAQWPADVTNWFLVEQASALERRKRAGQAATLYERVLAASSPATDALAQFAALRLASIAYERKAAEEAGRYLAVAGLNPDQCSLLDTEPIVTDRGVANLVYPVSAQRWGFEGSIVSNLDVSVDGKPVALRVVVAYPPFIFEDAVINAARGLRFKPIYRGSEQIGCSGFEQSYRFFIPGKN